MRFVFLGTGTSSGVPLIGCDCAVCRSPDPRDRRLRCSGALRWTDPGGTERTLLIDAGPDLRQQALREGLTRCDAILFTHNHVDHIFGLDEVRRFNAVMRAPVPVFADAHTMESLHRVFAHIFTREQNVNDSFVATLLPHLVRPGEPVDLFGLRFTPFTLLHGKLPVLGWRIDPGPALLPGPAALLPGPAALSGPAALLPMAYCTDVSGVPPQSWAMLHGLRTLVLDALRYRKHPTHFTVGQALSVVHECRPERAYFIHMSHDLPHQETQDGLPAGVFLAYDGLVLGAGDGDGVGGVGGVGGGAG